MFAGKQADNAAQYLGKGSHVNVVGRVQNNNYDNKDGETVYAMAFTAEEIDYLDTKAESEALRGRQGTGPEVGDGAPAPTAARSKPAKARKGSAKAPADEAADDVPF